MMKSIILTIIMLLILSCGGNSEDNIMPTPMPTPTPTPTPEPDGYSDTVKNLFFELCLPAANDQFCECSVNQIEENIPVDEFPVEDLMGRILSGEISEETSNSDIANLFPESVLEAVSPCFNLIIESNSVIEFLVFLILFYLSKKSRLRREKLYKKGDLKKINILFYLNLIFFFIFIIKFPDGRYGLSYMFVVIYFIFIYIFYYLNFNLKFLKLIKILNFSLIVLFAVFLLKNSIRILTQNEIASPLPDINYKDTKIFKKMSKKIENGKILEIYYGDAENIRFAEKNLCKYFKSPCIPNEKSIDDFIIEKKSDYLILKLREN